MYSIITLLLSSISLAKAAALPGADVTLAVKPVCGNFDGSPKDVKGTLPSLSMFKTIVTFGVKSIATYAWEINLMSDQSIRTLILMAENMMVQS